MAAGQVYSTSSHAYPQAHEVERRAWKSFDHCHALCESQLRCIQFRYDSGSHTCSISDKFTWGYKADGEAKKQITSGWMMDRVDDLFLRLESRCGIRDWFSPQEGDIFQKRR